MEENKRELNLEEMDKVSGGTGAQAFAYRRTLMEKYGIQRAGEVWEYMTAEEKAEFNRLMQEPDLLR